MKVHTLETEVWLPVPVREAFAFFSDAANLDRITPPWLHFRILTPAPVEVRAGTRLDYRLRWRLLPIRWQTEISVWDPPGRFVDRQVRGPYRLWSHEHRFEEHAGGTRMRDRVEYAVPGGPAEPWLHRFLVGPDVRAIFEHRRRTIREILKPG